MNAIFRRRSIRKFLDTPVPAEDVKKILRTTGSGSLSV